MIGVAQARAYRKASQVVGAYGEKITSGKQAQRLEGIGKGVAQKIDDYIETGTNSVLEEIQNDPNEIAQRDLERVQGIGPKMAEVRPRCFP